MRVLFIDVNCKNSSTGKIVYDLCQQLRIDGHEAIVCYGRGEVIDEPGIYKIGYDWETYLHALLARLTGLNGYFSFFSTQKLIKKIDEFKPDVIHIHELHGYFINIYHLLEYIKKLNTKVVWTFHCEYMYTGKCGYAYECLKFKTGCGNCPAKKDYPKSLFFDRTKKMYIDKYNVLHDMNFTIVTPSQWLADKVKMSFLSDKQINVIHNGIDTEKVFYSRPKTETDSIRKKYSLDNRQVVLSVAPNIMGERKGGRFVLEVAEKMTDKNIQFVLVGADETKRIKDNVLLISRTKNQDELAAWYTLADVFLICSKKENFPTTCLEAFCCGTPVVGLDEGGTKETVPTPFGAFGKTREFIKCKIEFFLDNDFDYEEIERVAKSLYSKKVFYEQYYKIYAERDM